MPHSQSSSQRALLQQRQWLICLQQMGRTQLPLQHRLLAGQTRSRRQNPVQCNRDLSVCAAGQNWCVPRRRSVRTTSLSNPMGLSRSEQV